jgi:hypothetical protein
MIKTFTIHIEPDGTYHATSGQRETEEDRIFQLRAKNMTYGKIAQELGIMPHKVQTICNDRHFRLCIQLAKTFDELAKLNYPAKKTEKNLEMQLGWSADGIQLMKEVFYGNKHDVV